MPEARTITIAPQDCEAFNDKFLRAAFGLIASNHLNGIFDLAPAQFKALNAYQVACTSGGGLVLGDSDIDFLIGFKRVMGHFSKPSQLYIPGQKLHTDMVAARQYLEQLIPPAMLPPDRPIT